MSATIIGKVSVKVTPDTDSFRRDAERQLAAVERQLRIVVDVVPNVVNEAAQRVRRQLDELGRDVTTNIRPDLDEAARREAEAALARLAQSRTATIRPDVEKSALSRVSGALSGLLGILGSLGSGAIKLTVLSAGLLSAGGGVASLIAGLSQFAPLALALPGLLAGAAIGVGTLVVALKDLPNQVPQVKTAMANIKTAITENFWAKARQPISDFVDSIGPVLTKGFGGVSTALGGFVGKLATSLKSSGPAFAGLFDQVGNSIKIFSGSAPALANIFTILTTAGASILPRLASGLSGLVERFSAFLTKAQDSGKLAGWFNSALTAVHGLGQAIGSVFSIIGSLLKGLSAGGGGLGGFASTLSAVAKAVAAPGFQGALEQAAKFASLLTGSLLGLAGALAKALGPVIGSLLSTLGPALASLAKGLGPVLASLGSALTGLISQLGPGLSALATGIVGALAPIAKALGPTLAALGPGLNALFASVGKVLPQLGQAFAKLLPAVAPVVNTLLMLAAKVLPPMAAAIAPLAGPLANLATQFGRLLDALAPVIGFALKSVASLGGLAPVLGVLINVVATVVGWLASFVGALGNVGGALSAVGAAAATAWAAVSSAFTSALAFVTALPAQFAAAGALIWQWITDRFNAAWLAVTTAFATAVSFVASLAGRFGAAGSAAWSWLLEKFSTAWASVTSAIGGAVSFIGGLPGKFAAAGAAVFSWMVGRFSAGWSAVTSAIGGAVSFIGGLPGKLASAGAGMFTWLAGLAARAISGLKTAFGGVVSFFAGLPAKIVAAVGNLGSILYNAGVSVIKGFINGIKSMAGKVKDVLGGITDKLTSWKGPPGTDAVILTPAGQMVIEGFIRGIKSRVPALRALLQDLTQDIPKKISTAKKAMADAGADLVRGLIDGLGSHESAVTNAVDRIRNALNVIGSASMRKILRGEAVDFSATIKSYDDVQTKIKAALDNLNNLKKEAADKAASIRDAILSGVSITSFTDGDGNPVVSFKGIEDAMRAALDKMKKFATDLAALKKLGLNSTELEQLANAGPDAGGTIAAAILAQGQKGVDQLNALQAKLTAQATSIGNTVSSAMYGAGIAAAQGLLKGLQSQEAGLIAYAKYLAEQIAQTIKKALDIHSPSRVMRAIGNNVGDGLRLGLEDSYKGVHQSITEFAKTISNAVFGSPTLSLNAMAKQVAAGRSGGIGSGATSNRTFIYHAAPGKSLPEEDVFAASQRSRFAW